MLPPPILQRARGAFRSWRPTTLAEQGMGEEVLETALASDVSLLMLPGRGIHFQDSICFRQVSMQSRSGRPVRLDLLVLTDSGHAIVAEVKRFGNPELAGREVLAQVVDYAASLSACSGKELAGHLGYPSFLRLVEERFPGAREKDDLASSLERRFRDGDLLLIVACDRAPDGTVEWLRSVAAQSSLSFDLAVLEVRPYVSSGEEDSVLFVPTVHSETHIVSRTAVVIRNEAGTERIVVNVQVESGEEIEENLAEASEEVRRREYPGSLKLVEARLELEPESLEEELKSISTRALNEDWTFVREALSWPDSRPGPYLRWGKGERLYVDGRLGIDLLTPWRPGVFVGVMVDPRDHRCGFSSPTAGADFDLIVSLAYNNRTGSGTFQPYCADNKAFRSQPEYLRLLERLGSDSGGFSFHDHVREVARPNLWHPIHLRKSLADVFAGATTQDQRYARWLDAARQALSVLLSGGELQALRDRLLAESAVRSDE